MRKSTILDPCIYWVFKGRDEQGFLYAHPAARRCVPKGRCLSCANAVLVARVTRVPMSQTRHSPRRAFARMESAMFNPTQVVIDAFVQQLQKQYEQVYGVLEPGYPGIIEFITRLAMENIANSDAPYHDMNHTIMVTLVGLEILRGKHISEGGVTPRDWLHFIISLLCHDIGYVRGVCRGDGIRPVRLR